MSKLVPILLEGCRFIFPFFLSFLFLLSFVRNISVSAALFSPRSFPMRDSSSDGCPIIVYGTSIVETVLVALLVDPRPNSKNVYTLVSRTHSSPEGITVRPRVYVRSVLSRVDTPAHRGYKGGDFRGGGSGESLRELSPDNAKKNGVERRFLVVIDNSLGDRRPRDRVLVVENDELPREQSSPLSKS